MGTPPQLTSEQRVAALAKAAASRKRRAEVKNQIKDRQLSIDDVLSLAATDEAIGKMRVKELLESLSGVGKIRVPSIDDAQALEFCEWVKYLSVPSMR